MSDDDMIDKQAIYRFITEEIIDVREKNHSDGFKAGALYAYGMLMGTIAENKLKGFVISAEELDKILNTSIEKTALSPRVRNCLLSENINTVRDLLSKKRIDLIKIPNFGKDSFDEVRRLLSGESMALGMNFKKWREQEGYD